MLVEIIFIKASSSYETTAEDPFEEIDLRTQKEKKIQKIVQNFTKKDVSVLQL